MSCEDGKIARSPLCDETQETTYISGRDPESYITKYLCFRANLARAFPNNSVIGGRSGTRLLEMTSWTGIIIFIILIIIITILIIIIVCSKSCWPRCLIHSKLCPVLPGTTHRLPVHRFLKLECRGCSHVLKTYLLLQVPRAHE